MIQGRVARVTEARPRRDAPMSYRRGGRRRGSGAATTGMASGARSVSPTFTSSIRERETVGRIAPGPGQAQVQEQAQPGGQSLSCDGSSSVGASGAEAVEA